MEKVAIIVPAYNAGKFIKDLLNDLLNQTYENWNCYIIDDGSTDDTKSQISEYLKDTRFRYFYQENAGPGAARNKGLDKMGEEEYIYMPDSDDRIDCHLLEDCVHYLNEVPIVDVVRFQTLEKSTHGKIIPQTRLTDVPKIIKGFEEKDNYPFLWGCWSYMLRSKVVKEHHLRFNTSLRNYEDLLFSLDLLYINPYILMVPDFYYIWCHKNESSLTACHYIKGIFTIASQCCETAVIPWLKEHGDFIFKKHLLKFINHQLESADIKASYLIYFSD